MGGGDHHQRIGQVAQGVDTTSPAWPMGATLVDAVRTPTRIRLTWPAASDDTGVVAYDIYDASPPVLVGTVSGAEHEWTHTGLLPSQAHTYSVRARDAASNVSTAISCNTSTQAPSNAPAWASMSPAVTVLGLGKRQVRLQWTAATDDHGEFFYEVTASSGAGNVLLGNALGVNGPTTVVWDSPRTLDPNTTYAFIVRAVDGEGNAATPSLTITGQTTLATTATPVWGSGTLLQADRTGWSSASVHASSPGLDADHYVFERRVASSGTWAPWHEVPTPNFTGDDLDPGRTWEFRVHFVDDDDVASAALETDVALPAPSLGTPPALPAAQSSDLVDLVSFLYTGADPVQQGVNVAAVVREHVGVIHGRVVRRSDGEPMAGVEVSEAARGEPIFGRTFTRDDGRFDFAVHGGGPVTLRFHTAGMLPVSRTVRVEWGRGASVGDVALVAESTTSTAVDFDDQWHVAQGEPVTDGDGTRRPTVIIPPDTTATMVLDDEEEEPLTTGTLRMTEYTVGTRGPAAMPGTIPPNVAYTWAAEFSFDEARAAGARSVRFSQPVAVYVDNFLDFPVGEPVPSGFLENYDDAWLGNELGNGVVIHVLSTTDSGGGAHVDVDGDSDQDGADDAVLSAQGLTQDERIRLHALYPSGAELWRFRVEHFTTWDANWGIWPPEDAETPGMGEPTLDRASEEVTVCRGSTIECQNRTLGDDIPLRGTPLHLHYGSDRTAARLNTLDVPIGEPAHGHTALPSSVIAAEVQVVLPDRTLSTRVNGSAGSLLHAHTQVTWDGMIHGRPVYGSVPATLRVGWIYEPACGRVERFGYSAQQVIEGNPARTELTFWNSSPITIGGLGAREEGLGGWTLNVHHRYDPQTGNVALGSGGTSSLAAAGQTTRPAVGGLGTSTSEGVAATGAKVQPTSLAMGPDGRLWYADYRRIRRVNADGTVETVAGQLNSTAPTCGADGEATATEIGSAASIALIGSDMVLVSEHDCHRIRIVANGEIHTLIGTGTAGYNGDGLDGGATQVNGPRGLALLQGFSVVFADSVNHRIRRYDLSDGLVRTLVGSGTDTSTATLLPATDRGLVTPFGLDVGPQGEIVFSDSYLHRVFRLRGDGQVETVAGTGAWGITWTDPGDGGLATAANLRTPLGVRVRQDGSVLMVDAHDHRVRHIRRDGVISTVAGNGVLDTQYTPFGSWNIPATTMNMQWPMDVVERPDGAMLIAEQSYGHVAEVRPHVGMVDSAGHITVPGEGGGELYEFDRHTGCHLRTLDAVTLQPRYAFSHVSGTCQVSAVQLGDASDGNTVTIDRVSATDVRVRGPFYAASTNEEEVQLTLSAGGSLTRVTHGADEWDTVHQTNGLLAELTDPLERRHEFFYETTGGALLSDESPAGVVTRLWTAANPTASAFTVHRILGTSTAAGPEYSYTVRSLPGGGRQYVDVSPGGDGSHTVTRTTTIGTNGQRVTTVASGSTVLSTSTSMRAADPRLGSRAWYASASSSTTAGNTLATRHEREVTATSAAVPALTQQIDRAYVNSESSARVTTQYDAAHSACGGYGRVLEITRGDRRVQTCLDARGRVASVQVLDASPTMHPVVFHYDTRGRMDHATQHERRVVSTWRADGRPDATSVGTWIGGTFTALQTTSTGYSTSTRRPNAQTLPGSRTVGMSINAAGELTSLTPPGRDAHTMTYDADGRMETFTSPPPISMGDPLTLGWEYNARRQLTQHTRADGGHVLFDYDDTVTGHLEWVDFPGVDVTYGYRPLTGAGETVSDGDCRLKTVYQGETVATSLVLEEVSTGSCAVTGTVSRTVNALFETTAVTVTGAPAVSFTLDTDADRLLTSAGGMTLGRDGETGRLTGTSIGEVATAATYTGYGELASHNATLDGTPELELAYTYDGLGRIATVTESGHHSRATTYGYDSAGRLETVTRSSTTIESYGYSGSGGSNGNRTSWTLGTDTFTAIYDAQDRLTSSTKNGMTTTSYEYDEHGQLETRTTGSAITTYAWDDRGALASVTLPSSTVIHYVLDPQGRRIGRKVGTTLERGWLYAGGLLPVAEVDNDGTTVRRVFVYATRANVPDLVMQRDGSSWVTYRVLSDHLGSVRAVVKADDSTVVQRMDYDAFGRVVADWVASGWVPLPFGYAGGLYDRDTGLVRFGAREYDASVGRWLSRDPILFRGGDGNLYAYVSANPINYVDPSGLLELPPWMRLAGSRLAALWAFGSALRTYGYFNPTESVDDARTRQILDWFFEHSGGSWYTAAGNMTAYRRGLGDGTITEAPFAPDEACMVAAEHYGINRRDRHLGSSGEFVVLATAGYDVAKIASWPVSSLMSTTNRPTTSASFPVTDWAIAGAVDGLMPDNDGRHH